MWMLIMLLLRTGVQGEGGSDGVFLLCVKSQRSQRRRFLEWGLRGPAVDNREHWVRVTRSWGKLLGAGNVLKTLTWGTPSPWGWGSRRQLWDGGQGAADQLVEE